MGQLVKGHWETNMSIVTSDQKGAFERAPSTFRETIAENHETYQPESGRYHLYVSYACPWATRALIMRSLKDLEDHIAISVVHPDMGEMGWSFDSDFSGATGDTLYGLSYVHQLYQKSMPDVTSKATVPILWDTKTQTIVNNESAEIIRIFNDAFNSLTGNTNDYYPQVVRPEIDRWNEEVYNHVNNGVYRCGFAKTQEAYDQAARDLFATLDKLDAHLNGKQYLVGDRLTEADIRLVVTLLRFDLVYYVHFKTNWRHVSEYENLHAYMKALYETDAIKKNHEFDHIKRHYYYSHVHLNPHRIIPMGPRTFL